MPKKKHAFCPSCGKPVKPIRRPLTSFHYQILVISTIASLGFAFIAFLIYRFLIQKKVYCPKCGSKVEFYANPEEYPKKMPVINLMEKLEQEKLQKQEKKQKTEQNESQGEKEYILCENCSREIDKKAKICPFCGWEQGKEQIETV
ncbi:MAG: hypothetical protein BAJALOKI3v1_150017 [Promethearchaeota archaeon]|nr:MAG: hypothetical protein BAJALOKI3v1_150017 [Candidatus Lokiarchaeota archaeon]